MFTPILIICSDALHKFLSSGRLSKVVGAILALVVVILFFFHRQDFELRTRNYVSIPVLLQHIKDDHPKAVISYGWTWDYSLFQKFFPGEATAEAVEAVDGFDPATAYQSLAVGECVFLVSHERPARKLLPTTSDFVVQPLAEIAASGSTELTGQINGGNGFTLIKVARVH